MIDITIREYFPINNGFCVKPFGNGHINDTFKLELEGDPKSYVLQRINTAVFRNPEVIIENHIKIQAELTKQDNSIQIANLVKTSNGNNFFVDKEGSVWRMTEFVNNSYTIDVVEESWQAFQAGKGYGWFVKACNSLNANDFYEPIKDFHRLSFRLEQLNEAIKTNKADRLDVVKSVIQFFKDRESSLLKIENLINEGDIPLRVVHNDTKINNILFRNSDAIAVIDLDTVGPGSILFDFGDAIRTSANTVAEDEKILEKVSFNLEAFKAFSEGYLAQTKNILTKQETDNLYKAPILMTYIMGIRFLADYLNGDIYYKTAYAKHNIDRCLVQLKLIESMESNEDFIKNTIENNLT